MAIFSGISSQINMGNSQQQNICMHMVDCISGISSQINMGNLQQQNIMYADG